MPCRTKAGFAYFFFVISSYLSGDYQIPVAARPSYQLSFRASGRVVVFQVWELDFGGTDFGAAPEQVCSRFVKFRSPSLQLSHQPFPDGPISARRMGRRAPVRVIGGSLGSLATREPRVVVHRPWPRGYPVVLALDSRSSRWGRRGACRPPVWRCRLRPSPPYPRRTGQSWRWGRSAC